MSNYNKNTITYIRNISFLKKMPESSIKEIMVSSNIKNIKKDENIFLEGEIANKFYIVLNGTFKLYNETINGTESISRLIGSGDFLGERSLSDNPIYSCNAQATNNSQILEINSAKLRHQIQYDQKTSLIILQELLNCQSKLGMQIEHLSALTAPQKIGWYLINSLSNSKSSLNRFYLKHDKSVIATFLGMKAETFSRAIKKLEIANVFIIGSEVIIKDINELYKYCNHEIDIRNSKSFKYFN